MSLNLRHPLQRLLRSRENDRQRFRWAVEAAPNGMILVDDTGRILLANSYAERLFGYEHDELTGKTIEDLVPARFLSEHTRDRKHFFRQPSRRPMGLGRDLFGRRKDGREIPVEIGLNPIATSEGTLVMASIVDITERKNLEDSLREREARYSLLAETVPEMLYTADANGNCDYVNRRYYAFTGSPPGSANGDGWIAAVHPDDRERVAHQWQIAVSQGLTFDVELRFRRYDDTYCWFSSHGVPVRDHNGQILKWFGVATDIDAQKHAHEALRAIDRQKDEFIAVLSHELRNPLAPIRNAAHLLRLIGPPTPQSQQLVALIERQTHHLARLVDDLLDVSRLTRGKIDLKKQPIDLVELASQVADAHQPLIHAHRHALTLDQPGRPVIIEGDEVRLTQIIGNLLNNAVKYTPDGGHINITVGEANGEAFVAVRDDGIGIRPELQPQIFDLFTQLSPADRHTRSEGGLGIGLSLVKGLVELHGGNVEMHSEGLGRGSEFRVYLPVD